MPLAVDGLRNQLRALTFDVFGTVVDWRSTVVETLVARAKVKSSSPEFQSVPEVVRLRVAALGEADWAVFAQQWRDAYKVFCKGFVPGATEWKDIDAHHHDSLVELLDKWKLFPGLYDSDEIRELSLVWHRLRPWEDSPEGIGALGSRYVTSTLSNGNPALLKDLDDFGGLGFRTFVSAADFGAYKPHPDVYLGAARTLGCQPGEVAMVAAHLGDLAAAHACGFKTIYVERRGEEDWDPGEERYQRAKSLVDIWVSEGEGGMMQVSRLLCGS